MGWTHQTIQGIARNVQWRTQSRDALYLHDQWGKYAQYTVLTFRVEQQDQHGNVVRSVPVELRGFELKGTLLDGEPVKVTGTLSKEGLINPKRTVNLNTQTDITVRPDSTALHTLGCGLKLVFAVGFLALFVAAAAWFLPAFRDAWQGGDRPISPPRITGS